MPPQESPHTRLVTIPISHYCEKARWALERAGIAYREEPHVQFAHVLASRRAGGKGTVPVLVTGGRVIGESADIVAFAGLGAGDAALERALDAELGPEGRRWMYFHLLGRKDIARAYNNRGVPAWERHTFLLGYPVLSRLLGRLLAVGPDTTAVDRSFDAVAERLADGRRYLAGDAFTATDLTFASLAAPLVLPREYGVPLPGPDELPPAMAAAVRAYREHPAGAFALRVFREDRQSAYGS